MTCGDNNTGYQEILEALIKDGTNSMADVLKTLLNSAMRLEREQYLKAGSYERTDTRTDYANGYKDKTLKTRVGKVELKVPQVRSSQFYPSSIEKGSRSERALLLSMAEMYVQGVSTRKVSAIVEDLCGFEVSSSDVSRATASLDQEFEKWRSRPIGEITYLYVDATYEKIRYGGSVVDCAVLTATGVDPLGKRIILGISVSLSEAEPHWRNFFENLSSRGMHGLKLIISDAHSGLKAARKAVFPSVSWQRCQFHLQQNAQSYVPKKSMKSEVAEKIRYIFNAPDEAEAQRMLQKVIDNYSKTAPDLARWIDANIPEGLTIFRFPRSHQKRLRTSNVVERLNKEIKRRTNVATLFPNTNSCLRLVTAIVMEISEEWETGRRYLTMTETE